MSKSWGSRGGISHIQSHIMWAQSTELHRKHDKLKSKFCIYIGQASQEEFPSHITCLRSQRSMLDLLLNAYKQPEWLRLRSQDILSQHRSKSDQYTSFPEEKQLICMFKACTGISFYLNIQLSTWKSTSINKRQRLFTRS